MIRNSTAELIAAVWHGGQWSALYQLSSNGIYFLENHLRYLQEIERDLHPEYDLHPSELSKKGERDLNSLKEWVIRQGEAKGIRTEWHKHELYGYMIPYIAEDVPDELADKVRPVAYLK